MTAPGAAAPPGAADLAELLTGAGGPLAGAGPGRIAEAARQAEDAGLRTLALPEPGGAPGHLEATTLAALLLRATRTLTVEVPVRVDRLEPYNAARVLATLCYLAPGRVRVRLAGGTGEGPDADLEARAEYLAALRALWSGFPPEAVLADRAASRYFDASLIRPAAFSGRRYRVAGPLNLPTPPGAPPFGEPGATRTPPGEETSR